MGMRLGSPAMMRKGEREEGLKSAVWSKVYAPGTRKIKDLLPYATRRVCDGRE